MRAASEAALGLWIAALNAAAFLADLRARLAVSSGDVVFENLDAMESIDVSLGDVYEKRGWWWHDTRADEEEQLQEDDSEGVLCTIRGYGSARRYVAKMPVSTTASWQGTKGTTTPGGGSRALQEFRREVSNLEQMRGNPHIVELAAVLQIKNTVFVVTEAVEGGSLYTNLVEREIAGRPGYAEGEAKSMLRVLLRTLVAVHHAGLTHRNVSFHSIFCVNRDDITSVKLGDFELSREDADSCGTRVWDQFTPPELVEKVGTQFRCVTDVSLEITRTVRTYCRPPHPPPIPAHFSACYTAWHPCYSYDGRKVDIWQVRHCLSLAIPQLL